MYIGLRHNLGKIRFMSKKPIDIDRKAMTDILSDLESRNTYTNRNALYLAASDAYHSARGLKVNPSVIYLRVRDWGLTLKTPVGKRGRAKGSGPVPRAKPGKLKGNKSLAVLRKEMTADKDAYPFLKVLTKVENGSLKSLIRLNCLYCSNWQPKEIKLCECESCPLHAFRPYK